MEHRAAIQAALAERKMSQARLAEQIGITPQALGRTLKLGRVVSDASNWPAILDALGLEVVIRPKGQS